MAEEQIWFFIWESVQQRPRLPQYMQGYLPLSEVSKGMSLGRALKISGASGQVDDHSFWIHSNSMKAAVQLLSDDSMQITWKLYCQQDAVVTIHIRPYTDPSPNTSRAASHQQSLVERRKLSGRRKVSDIFIRPPLSNITSSLDAMSLEPISSLHDGDKVTLDLGDGKQETFSKQYLLGKKFIFQKGYQGLTTVPGWIGSGIVDGKDVTNIVIETLTKNRRPIQITLSDTIWHTSLLRGPWKDEFQSLWEMSKSWSHRKTEALSQLKQIPDFELMSKRFIRDLRCFGFDQAAQTRLNNTNHEFFLGSPYFSSDTVAKILQMPFAKSTVGEELVKIAQRKLTRENQNELCAAHDLSPLFEAAFDLDWEQLKPEMGGDVLRNAKNTERRGFGATLRKLKGGNWGKKSDGNEK
jgi:hypothetical protein